MHLLSNNLNFNRSITNSISFGKEIKTSISYKNNFKQLSSFPLEFIKESFKAISYSTLFALSVTALVFTACLFYSCRSKKAAKPQASLSLFPSKPLQQDVSYRIENVFNKILQAQEEGKKVALFIGRTDAEPIPQEEGWQWFSLDQLDQEKTENKDRHLKLDINDSFSLEKIKQTFDRVVVDFSVVKFIHTPWPTLHSLLKQEPESELILESNNGSCQIDEKLKKPVFDPAHLTFTRPVACKDKAQEEKNFEEWQKRVGLEKEEEFYQEYRKNFREMAKLLPNTPSSQKEAEIYYRRHFKSYIISLEKLNAPLIRPNAKFFYPQLFKKIKKYVLTNFFNKIELREGNFPYREGLSAEGKHFWVIHHPKKLD